MFCLLKFQLQRFAEDDAPQTITVGDKEYTAEQIAELEKSYRKLESDHTKKSQSLSELEKKAADLQKFADDWGPFAQEVNSKPALAKAILEAYENVDKGEATQKDANTIQSAINKAQKSGDDEAVKELRDQLSEVRSQLAEQEIDKTFATLEKRAKEDGLDDFSLDGFKEFADKWLEDELGIGDDDDVTPKHFRQAYTAYEAHLLKEQIKRGKVPQLGSGSNGAPPAKGKDDNQPRGLKARSAAAMDKLLRS